MTSHIIELNGKKYDALTGKLINGVHNNSAPTQHQRSTGHSIDGVVRPKAHSPRKVTSTHISHHEVAKSKTLMRRSVKKPTAITPQHKQRPSQPKVTYLSTPAQTPVISTPPAKRLDRADQIQKSKLIRRFGSDIVPAPKHLPHPSHSSKAAHIAVASVSTPVFAEPIDTSSSVLANAISHNEPRLKKTPAHHRAAKKLHMRPKTLSISAAVMAFVVLGGFFAYSNVPNLSMRVAAMRSDVNASLPGYKPAGFALNGPIKYQTGEIIVGYKSNSDNRNYKLTLKTSEWDAESLRENYVDGLKTAYQTVQDKGKTVYLYEDSSATWVDSGVWYKIEGNSQLNSEQVLRIVSSL